MYMLWRYVLQGRPKSNLTRVWKKIPWLAILHIDIETLRMIPPSQDFDQSYVDNSLRLLSYVHGIGNSCLYYHFCSDFVGIGRIYVCYQDYDGIALIQRLLTCVSSFALNYAA